MSTSTLQLERLAAKGYKELKVIEGNSDNCILGAACYGKFGLTYTQLRLKEGWHLGFVEIFKRSPRFIAGVVAGFDGFEKECKITKSYLNGWNFGRRMRRKYLGNKFHYTKQANA